MTVLVVDDGGYGMLRYDQQVAGDPERGVDLHGPDWVALAAAFGLAALAVPSVGEPLRAALAGGGRPRRPDPAARTRRCCTHRGRRRRAGTRPADRYGGGACRPAPPTGGDG